MKIYGVEVTLDENGKVKYGILDGARVYPYVQNKKEGGYDQVCGYYKPESFRKIIREDRGGWI